MVSAKANLIGRRPKRRNDTCIILRCVCVAKGIAGFMHARGVLGCAGAYVLHRFTFPWCTGAALPQRTVGEHRVGLRRALLLATVATDLGRAAAAIFRVEEVGSGGFDCMTFLGLVWGRNLPKRET